MLIPTLENLLNRGLPRSPRARQLCGELAGSWLEVAAEGLPPLTLESDGAVLRLRMRRGRSAQQPAPDAAAADAAMPGVASPGVAAPGVAAPPGADPMSPRSAQLRGGPFSLLSLAGFGAGDAAGSGAGSGAGPGSATLQRGAATITGDAAVAEKFRELLRLLRPDPEEELALLIGDVPAHGAGRLLRGALRFGGRAAHTAARNLAEYLAHESRDLVSAPEGRALLGGVDLLREDVDRLEARIARLPPPSTPGSPASGPPVPGPPVPGPPVSMPPATGSPASVPRADSSVTGRARR
ncbi:MAG TPA: hypothetical protein VMB48_14540 [Steroidobacteraceae bacterium]|nr:hypothetical protein [Steroidobacteraceae bacterium]